MSLKIRLARAGAKKRPFYRVVIAENRAPRDGKYIEKVGTYNPLLEDKDGIKFSLQEDRIKYWLSVGAKPSDRVAKFLMKKKLIELIPYTETPKKSKPKQKALERLEEKKQQEASNTETTNDATTTPPSEDTPAEAVTTPTETNTKEKVEETNTSAPEKSAPPIEKEGTTKEKKVTDLKDKKKVTKD